MEGKPMIFVNALPRRCLNGCADMTIEADSEREMINRRIEAANRVRNQRLILKLGLAAIRRRWRQRTERDSMTAKLRNLTDPLTTLLRLEGFTVFLTALGFYAATGQNWFLFGVLILAPDLAMAGYLFGNRIGAICYNCTHTYAAPAVFAGLGWIATGSAPLDLVLIWVAHIGLDRAVGYGLKRRSGFKSTHLSGQPQ